MAAESKGLNVALWVIQVLLFAGFAMAGFAKATAPIAELSQKMAWVPRFSPGTVRFIGVAELCGALGMILPSLTRIMPRLTPLAGIGLAVVMGLAAGHHLTHGEAKFAPVPLALGALAAFVAWGRWKKAPITPR
jgi:putative oxidoreductase